MNATLRNALAIAGFTLATQATAQVSFYESENFAGRSFSTQKQLTNLDRYGFNDRASSAVVVRDRWEVCEDVKFEGRCVVLRPGRYASLSAMGLNNRISSVRIVTNSARIDDNRYAPAPVAVYDYHRRQNERLYEAQVVAVRAVVGPPEQRCWVEREQAVQNGGGANIPGAIVGGVLGGILGHQIGGGTGKQVATVGGAVAGAAVGANVGRTGGQQVYSQDVQRCAAAPGEARPDYWDVTYTFRGLEHRMQTSAPPGPTVSVNAQGEPRA
jgi:uncharacterized protein YcfJ